MRPSVVLVIFICTIVVAHGHRKTSDAFDAKIKRDGILGLANSDQFGSSVTTVGDLDGDGVNDLIVGAPQEDDGGPNRGAVWILFLNSGGTFKSYQKISDTQGGFSGTLGDGDRFGTSIATVGDLDSDGVPDLAVGAPYDDDGGTEHGAVWILFLNSDSTVKSHQKISDTEGGFTGILDDYDYFGASVTGIGDLNGDGVLDLTVGALGDDDGDYQSGAVWILFLNEDGTVKSHQKISNTEGGFTGTLGDTNTFGCSVADIGDLDGDGVTDLAIGAHNDDDGGPNRGAMWILFMATDGTVKSHRKISDTQGGFTGVLDNYDDFGTSVTTVGDLDGDGVTDLAVGARNDHDSGDPRGAVWILFLNSDGTVKSHQKISDAQGGFIGNNGDAFGWSATNLGDLNGDGVIDLAVGAYGDDDGGIDRGAVWILFLNADGTVKSNQKISNTNGMSTTPPPSHTPTSSPSRTATPTQAPSSTSTASASRTPTPTPSRTLTPTPSTTLTASTSRTPSASRTPTPTSTSRTPTPSPTPSASRTATPTRTSTPSPIRTPTPSRTRTPTQMPTPSATPSPSPCTLITDSRPRSGIVSFDSVWYGDIQLKSDKGTQLVSVSLDSRGSVEVFLSDPTSPETIMWSLSAAGVLEIDLDDDRLHDTDVLRVGIKGTSHVPTSFQLTTCRSKRLTAEFVQDSVSDNEYAFYYVPTTTSERDLEITLVPLGRPISEPFLYMSHTVVAPTRDMSRPDVPWSSEERGVEQSITIKSPTGSYYISVYGHVGGAFRIRGRLLDHDDHDDNHTLIAILIPVLVLLAAIVFVVWRTKAHRHRVQESIRPLPSSTVELRPVEYETEQECM